MEEPLYTKTEYRDRILTSLYHLQNKNVLCDADIVSKDGPVPIHRVIIAISDCQSFKEAVVAEKATICCKSFSKVAVDSLVKYLYTGEIEVKTENVQEFIDLCKSVDLHDIIDVCINELHVKIGDVNHVALKVVKGDNTAQNRKLSQCGKAKTQTKNTRKHVRKTRKSKQTSKNEKKKSVTEKAEKHHIGLSSSILIDGDDSSLDISSLGTNDLSIESPSPVEENSTALEDEKQVVMELNNDSVKEQNRNKETAYKSDSTIIRMSPKSNPYYESPELDYFGRKRSKKRRLENAAKREKNEVKKSCRKSAKQNTSMTKNKTADEQSVKNVDEELEDETIIEEPEKEKKNLKTKRTVVYRWCHKCEIRFSEKELRRHMRTEHPPYVCKLCTWTGLLSRELALHMYNKHQMLVMPEKYPLLTCDHKGCNFKTLVSYALDRHKECHNRLVRHLCDVCGSSFATAGGLREHALRHADENPIYKCQQCDAVFGWKCKLKSHELKEHGTYLLCEICPYRTKYKDKLTMHLHHEHSQPLPDKQKILHCDKCDFYCISNSKLRFHKLRHEGVKNHTCTQCGKSYLNSHQLKIHINSTHGDRRFSCHLCDYVSKRKSEINNHIKSRHSDVRPFTCNLCDYSCKLRGNLQKHIRMVHKVEVVTRNSLHKNMLQTGKGYTELLNAMKTGEIRLGEKVETMTTESETEHTQNDKQLEEIPPTGNVEVLKLPYDHSIPPNQINEIYRRNFEAMMKSRDEEQIERPPQTYATLESNIYQVISNVHSTNTQGYHQAYSN